MTKNNRTCSIKDIVHRNHCMEMTIVVFNGKVDVRKKVTTLLRIHFRRDMVKLLHLTNKLRLNNNIKNNFSMISRIFFNKLFPVSIDILIRIT